MSLRVRVAVWIAGAVLLCGVVLLLMVREGVRQALIHELDANLRAEADEILLEREQLVGQPERLHEIMELQALGHTDRTWYSQLLDAQGREIYSTTTTPVLRPRLAHLPAGQPESVNNYRVVERTSTVGEQPLAVVRVGTSLASIQDDMSRIDRQVMFAALSVLILAPVAGFVLATASLRPITEMSEQTAKLQPQNLEARLPLRGANDELDRLATVINGLLGRISIYVGDHRGLMANAAHQLRTPLAAIRSCVEVILGEDENSPENRDTLLKVIEQIESLESLVNQLLLLAETEVGNLRPAAEQIRLDDLLQRSFDMFEAVAESRGVTLQLGHVAQAAVQGNLHHLRQVVNNLIDNAIKFTAIREVGPRTISIGLNRREHAGLVELQISDTGIGISPKHLPHIFDRFYRADAARRNDGGVGGNGLGLSIVKAVVESHGGEVQVKSVAGEGTTFTIRLPLASAEVLQSP